MTRKKAMRAVLVLILSAAPAAPMAAAEERCEDVFASLLPSKKERADVGGDSRVGGRKDTSSDRSTAAPRSASGSTTSDLRMVGEQKTRISAELRKTRSQLPTCDAIPNNIAWSRQAIWGRAYEILYLSTDEVPVHQLGGERVELLNRLRRIIVHNDKQRTLATGQVRPSPNLLSLAAEARWKSVCTQIGANAYPDPATWVNSQTSGMLVVPGAFVPTVVDLAISLAEDLSANRKTQEAALRVVWGSQLSRLIGGGTASFNFNRAIAFALCPSGLSGGDCCLGRAGNGRDGRGRASRIQNVRRGLEEQMRIGRLPLVDELLRQCGQRPVPAAGPSPRSRAEPRISIPEAQRGSDSRVIPVASATRVTPSQSAAVKLTWRDASN